jgi:hypothetical protein
VAKESEGSESYAVDIFVDTPLRIQLQNGNELTITCYQQISGTDKALSMRLRFSENAAGNLISILHRLVESGQVQVTDLGAANPQ